MEKTLSFSLVVFKTTDFSLLGFFHFSGEIPSPFLALISLYLLPMVFPFFSFFSTYPYSTIQSVISFRSINIIWNIEFLVNLGGNFIDISDCEFIGHSISLD